jgi:formylglycine-generating enzyme required for sulfatase activity/serine/threonine protein kinase
MASEKKCPECGASLPAETPGNLCPQCALRGALERPETGTQKLEAPGPCAPGSQRSKSGSAGAHFDFLDPCEEPDRIGRLGGYEIIEFVGRGGMGIVFRGYDPKLKRVVAIKAMTPELASSPVAVRRFLREARAAAAVGHDRVVTIFAVEDGTAVPFLVMEFIEGQSLQKKIAREGALPVEKILRIGLQIAEGLAAAHRQGLVHRDINPANILLENGVERVKITDFGLARAVDDGSLTHSSLIAGTPLYMAPEQVNGHAVDHRTDLFALGGILYTMSTGVAAFRADSLVAVLRRVSEESPRPIRSLNPNVPDWLVAIVERLMAKNPDDRIQSADELGNLLQQRLAGLQADGDDRRDFRAARSRRMRAATVGSVVFGAILCTLAVTEFTSLTDFTSRFGRAEDQDPSPGKGPDRTDAGPAPPIAVSPFSSAEARTHQEAWAGHLNSAIQLSNSIGSVLRLIPPGEFQMGSVEADLERLENGDWFFAGWAADRLQFEIPRHRVRITRPFYLGAHEITVVQFRKFVEASGYKTVAELGADGGYGWTESGWQQGKEFDWQHPGYPQSDDSPVGNIAWEDATEFCRWLGKIENQTYRLPTEAEWEFACRGGTQTWFYSGDRGEGLESAANIADESLKLIHSDFTWARPWNDGFPFPAPVGRFEPNAFGLHDMHGNVWEWCEDYYDPEFYRTSSDTDPVCRAPGRIHVFRGGGWDNYPGFCRSADRYSSHSPTLRTNWAGFRIVMEAPEKDVKQSR